MMELVNFDGFNSFIYYFFTPILRLPPLTAGRLLTNKNRKPDQTFTNRRVVTLSAAEYSSR